MGLMVHHNAKLIGAGIPRVCVRIPPRDEQKYQLKYMLE